MLDTGRREFITLLGGAAIHMAVRCPWRKGRKTGHRVPFLRVASTHSADILSVVVFPVLSQLASDHH